MNTVKIFQSEAFYCTMILLLHRKFWKSLWYFLHFNVFVKEI